MLSRIVGCLLWWHQQRRLKVLASQTQGLSSLIRKLYEGCASQRRLNGHLWRVQRFLCFWRDLLSYAHAMHSRYCLLELLEVYVPVEDVCANHNHHICCNARCRDVLSHMVQRV